MFQTLPIPTAPFDLVTMDFVIHLSILHNIYNAIVTIGNKFSIYVQFYHAQLLFIPNLPLTYFANWVC